MSRPNMTPVYTGVSTVLWGLILTFLGIFLLFVTLAMALDMFGGAAKNPDNLAAIEGKGNATVLVARIAVYTILAGAVLNILGLIFCLGAPESMEGKGLIYVAVACNLVAAGISVAGEVTTVSKNVGYVGQLLSLISFITFIVFLGKVGAFIGSAIVSKGAGSTLRVGVYTVVSYGIAIAALVADSPAVGAIFALVSVVLAIIFLVRYIMLLVNTKAALKFAPADDADM